MTPPNQNARGALLIMAAGAKGAIGSTLAAAAAALETNPAPILSCLTTIDRLPWKRPAMELAGWDTCERDLPEAAAAHGVLPADTLAPLAERMARFRVLAAPEKGSLQDQVAQIRTDIRDLTQSRPDAAPVFVNLLPARGWPGHATRGEAPMDAPPPIPDIAYAMAAVAEGVPVVNFTPNFVEIPALIAAAEAAGVPVCGRDGKTGQTYFKVALASALMARGLRVDGWYSLNILGNADGANLMDPDHARDKLANKTGLLDEILGYPVATPLGVPTHKVHIDYYPPRGDAKEAWDVIDIAGLFGLPMSIRLNLQGRDSILAAPMVIDLSRWMAALSAAGRGGAVPELAFYFKKSIGNGPPRTFQDQMTALSALAAGLAPAADGGDGAGAPTETETETTP